MRQNVSKVLNFRTLWKSLRRQRKSFSWSTLQSMECTILINNELDFSPLLTKITYTCSLLEIYCKINLFLEVKMCLKKQSSIIFWLKFESKGELKCGGCKVNMACSNLSVSPSCGAVWTFWCSDNLDYYGCKSPPLPFKSPIRLLLKAALAAAMQRSLFPNQQYSRKSDSLEFFSTTVVVPPSAYRAILQISRRRSKTCGFSTIIIYYLRQCRAER